MNYLDSVITRTKGYSEILNAVMASRLPIEANGLSGVHKALVISALLKQTEKKGVLIVPDEADAVRLAEDTVSLGLNTLILPSRDLFLGSVSATSKEYEHKRIDTLSKLLDGDFDLLILSVEAATQCTVSPEVLRVSRIKLALGDTVLLSDICNTLLTLGYSRCELVTGAGQFALRGGILDIFPTNKAEPVRVEFWGDEIDSISTFDVLSQRRNENINEIELFPASELVCDKNALADALKEYSDTAKKLSDKQKAILRCDIEALDNGISFSLDRYTAFIQKGATVFDYIEESLILTSEFVAVKDRLKNLGFQRSEDIKTFLDEGYLSSKTAELYLDENHLLGIIEKGVLLDNFVPSSVPFALKNIVSFNFKRNSVWSGDIKVLKEDIQYTLSTGGLAVVAAGSEKSAQILNEDLSRAGFNTMLLKNIKGLPTRGVVVTVGGLSSGFEVPELKFLFITHRHQNQNVKKRGSTTNKNAYNSLEELKFGDYVVHASHGIGIFEGINRITTGTVTKDYIKIKYAKSDILYVPVTQLDLVSKYIGAAEEGTLKLHRLGGEQWQKTRKRVKGAVKEMAKQLTALYAKRLSVKGHAFSEDTDLQNDFERRFEYEETEDQLRCISEIKNDMERAVPMDRLLCGDVGFGKTEVALRAAFKCISEGKQCAVLVPTTILAWQHYNTILQRFGEMPLEVRMLSRFVTSKAQQKTLNELRRGSVDLVVGTHRLISKDVEFRDLGLVIIDEEQRFGVAQKEKLKEKYPAIDVLTLSATPIPRTLNMAMSGLRDLSSIDEAPGDRHPVQTYVLEHNEGVILEAIRKELRRGGQVYYLHNRVDTIERVALKLKESLPDANIAVAHGKMSEEQLSDVWKRLVEQEIDILVCTTIIETGVDVPTANTLIIEDADRFGLSQLHQLRGRVGRSPRRAYAYFCYRQGKGLSEIATKRLDAIREYTEFGSGFKIAMRDLEIRGAGSVLGAEQHGNMEAVGYDMYLKLLSAAIDEEKGIKRENYEETECLVDLSISAHIPENYIESLPARLGIYRRIAEIKTNEDASDVIDELCDRFGDPPKSVMGLIDIALFRSKAAQNGIYEITQTAKTLEIKVNEIKEEQFAKLSDGLRGRIFLKFSDKPYYSIKLNDKQTPLEALKEIADLL
ncbi:MAG: transcription-repair coupling factor [Clostridia bacterium]|nr:transcription-repair coupling factor [Clostridia bacterium]